MRRTVVAMLGLLTMLSGGCGDPSPRAGKGAGAPPVHDGSSVGNGGDDLPATADSAWFFRKRRIRYCYELADDFGVSRDEAEAQLALALRTWRRYIATNGVNKALHGRLGTSSKEFELGFVGRALPRCDGTEHLTFYLGVENEEVLRARERYFNPLAFAHRRGYDAQDGWGSGFVWVQGSGKHSPGFPRWSRASTLQSILLHELGHVAGCGHVAGTVMESDIVDTLRARTNSAEVPPVASIDGTRALFPRLGWREVLVFRNAQRTVVDVWRVDIEGEPHGPEPAEAVPSRKLRVVDLREYDRQEPEAPVFKVVFEPEDDPVPYTAVLSSVIVSYVGTVRLSGGESRKVLLHFNSPSGLWLLFWWNERTGGLSTFGSL